MIRRIAAAAALASLVVAGCESSGSSSPPTTGGEGSRRLYRDVESLRQDSPFVLVGEVMSELERSVDTGGSSDGGLPMVYYAVRILERGKGATPAEQPAPCGRAGAGQVCLAWADLPDVAPLHTGQKYVFFVESLAAAQAPGVNRALTPLYVPIGAMAGAFEITASGGRPLDPRVERVQPSGASAQAFTISELLGKGS